MPRSRHHPLRTPVHQRVTLATILNRVAGRLREVLCRSRRGIPVEVVIADPARRRAFAGEIQRTLQQLRRALGSELPSDLAVVVQQTVSADRPLTGCVQIRSRADGPRAYLVRLALQVDGRRLAIDDVLAALADACVGIVVQSSSASILIPLESAPLRSMPAASPSVVNADPLAPRPNGTISRAQLP